MGKYQKVYEISLTGEKSHRVVIPIGQGSFSIGTKGISKGKYDAWVEKASIINWDAFNGFYTGYGEQNRERFPYGDWPRFLYYSGSDCGFIEWSYRREIEEFHWFPQSSKTIDFTDANIKRLSIHTEEHTIQISTGEQLRSLIFSGNPELIELYGCKGSPYVTFHLKGLQGSQAQKQAFQLPVYKALKHIPWIDINNHPIGPAFDCESLLQFPDLTGLNLSGNMTHLHALEKFDKLEQIGLRFVPDLQDMPKLSSFINLKGFIAYNVEETAGKALRVQMKQLMKEKEMEQYSGVTKLRKRIWFDTEYGIPFASWEDKQAEIATKAYKACLKVVKKSKTETELHEAIIKFVETINQMDGIETSEREDVGVAIGQIAEASKLELPKEKWQLWFDEVRDF